VSGQIRDLRGLRRRPPSAARGARRIAWLLAVGTVALLAGPGDGALGALSEESFSAKVEGRPELASSGEALSWTASDPTGAYLLRRTVPGRESDYALVKAAHARPPAIPGETVGYRVKGVLEKSWSAEVSIAYEPVAVEGTLLGGLSESSFLKPTEGRPSLAAAGEVLSWNDVEPSGAYLLKRSVAGGEPQYALVKATRARPPAIPGSTVGYRVEGLLGSSWSPEVSVHYATAEEAPAPEPPAPEGPAPEPPAPEGPAPTGSGVAVSGAPTGPAPPRGGWHVAFADAFGAPLGTGPGQDNFVYPNTNACCNPYEDHHGNNHNELEVFNAGQVRVGSEGLELIDKYAPKRAPAEGGYPVRNYVSGSISTSAQYSTGGWRRFQWKPGGGETWAFECNCKLPANSPMSGVDPGWWSLDRKWTDEIDFFEEWGWGRSCELSLLTSCLTGVAWLYDTSPLRVQESSKALYSLFDPSAGFHRYTTVIYPNNTLSEYIDGQLQRWVGNNGIAPAPPYFTKAAMHLVMTNALRDQTPTSGPNPYPGFSSGTRTFAARSIAVYEDGAHAGLNVSGGGVAPGTIVK
jgi:hypothetical protein